MKFADLKFMSSRFVAKGIFSDVAKNRTLDEQRKGR